jgi:hypothetical protein
MSDVSYVIIAWAAVALIVGFILGRLDERRTARRETRGQPRPAAGAVATLPVTSLFGANTRAPMAGAFTEQARQYTDTQACEAPTRWPDDIVFPVDVDGSIRRVVIAPFQLRKFISLDRPVRSRRLPDGSQTPGFRGMTTVYRDLLFVAKAYGWVIPVGNKGVEWSPEYRSIGRRVMHLSERNNVQLPPPGEGDDTE